MKKATSHLAQKTHLAKSGQYRSGRLLLSIIPLCILVFASCGGGGNGSSGGGGGGTDMTPPTVTATSPDNNATGVTVNASISVTFSEPMNAETITGATFTVRSGSTDVPGTVSYSGTTATFTPSHNLALSTSYTATVTTGARDLAGNALASNYVWNFTTGSAPDTIPPAVVSTSPDNNATGVTVNATLSITFSEAVIAGTIFLATFTVRSGSTDVPGTVSYSGTTATFTPSHNLALSTSYTVTVSALDLAGILTSNYVWNFTTSGEGIQGEWTPTGSMGSAREVHTSTLLPNGLVLVAGGQTSSGHLSSAELYDPATGVWTTTGSMGSAREAHTATLLPNGLVLVTGDPPELYDHATETWTATGSMGSAHGAHTATLLPNGLVLVTGGETAELYDPAMETWTATGSMTTARDYHTATLLPNGWVLVAGGRGIYTLASAEIYLSEP